VLSVEISQIAYQKSDDQSIISRKKMMKQRRVQKNDQEDDNLKVWLRGLVMENGHPGDCPPDTSCQ